MATIRFTLREPNATNPTPIVARVRWGGIELKYPTGETVHPKHWIVDNSAARKGQTKGEGRVSSKMPGYSEANTRLSNLRSIILDEIRKFQNDHKQRLPSKRELKEALDIRLTRKVITDHTFVGFVEKFVQECYTRKSKHDRKKKSTKGISPNTIKNYERVKSLLNEFMEDVRGIDFEDINKDFADEFYDFLSEQKNFATNVISKHFKSLKTILIEAEGKGKIEKLNRETFTTETEEADTMALTISELSDLAAAALSDSPALDNARDLWMVGFCTGQRYSDFTRIGLDHIQDGIVEIASKKTGTIAMIPVLPQLLAILEKYKDTETGFPRKITNSNLNQYIKDAAKKVESLCVQVNYEKPGKQGVRVIVKRYKWELITVHTARRTFATIMYDLGVPVDIIMIATGHTSEREFFKYIRRDKKDRVRKMLPIWNEKVGALMKVV